MIAKALLGVLLTSIAAITAFAVHQQSQHNDSVQSCCGPDKDCCVQNLPCCETKECCPVK